MRITPLRKVSLLACLGLALGLLLPAVGRADSQRVRKLLDFGWKFHLGSNVDLSQELGLWSQFQVG